MIWLALLFAISIGLVIGLITRNWKRALFAGLIALLLGVFAAFGIAAMEWFMFGSLR